MGIDRRKLLRAFSSFFFGRGKARDAVLCVLPSNFWNDRAKCCWKFTVKVDLIFGRCRERCLLFDTVDYATLLIEENFDARLYKQASDPRGSVCEPRLKSRVDRYRCFKTAYVRAALLISAFRALNFAPIFTIRSPDNLELGNWCRASLFNIISALSVSKGANPWWDFSWEFSIKRQEF